MLHYLKEAAKIAVADVPNEKRNFLLGSVGIRKDGVVVSARNGAVNFCSFSEYKTIPNSHAELRVLAKMGKGGIIYVSRVLKKDGSLAMARPCGSCRLRLRMAKVKRVYYSIDRNHYGIFFPGTGEDKIYEII